MRLYQQTAFAVGIFCAALLPGPGAGHAADAPPPAAKPGETKAGGKPADKPADKPAEKQPEAVAEGKYREPLLHPPAFDVEALGMIEAERREYAQNLAAFALAVVAGKTADPEGKSHGVPQAKYDLARKLVGLAAHLDPRSRPVVVANGRLKAGVIPPSAAVPGMAPGSFASLLVGRSGELMKTGSAADVRLAGCFLDVAMGLDPASDDVVFAYESFTMAGRKPDWSGILGGE